MSKIILPNLSSPPILDRHSAGFMYWDYGKDTAYIWQGSYWREFIPPSGTGFVKMSGGTIYYDDTLYLPISGGTLTGDLFGTNLITNETDIYDSTPKLSNIITLTQIEYNSILLKDANTLYIII